MFPRPVKPACRCFFKALDLSIEKEFLEPDHFRIIFFDCTVAVLVGIAWISSHTSSYGVEKFPDEHPERRVSVRLGIGAYVLDMLPSTPGGIVGVERLEVMIVDIDVVVLSWLEDTVPCCEGLETILDDKAQL